jgi:hypothetical protein
MRNEKTLLSQKIQVRMKTWALPATIFLSKFGYLDKTTRSHLPNYTISTWFKVPFGAYQRTCYFFNYQLPTYFSTLPTTRFKWKSRQCRLLLHVTNN